jgi:two-component system, cell cycle sensor histidine kinase and response regulator CckA
MRNRLLLICLVLAFLFSSYLFYSFYVEAKRKAIIRSQKEQFVYARQAARGIEDFFSSWTYKLSVFAKSEEIAQMSGKGKEYMALLFNSNKDMLKGITRVDAAGRIVYTYPTAPEAIGRDISYQPHIRNIMRDHKPAASDVIRPVQGYDTIALHVPVFRDKTFDGTLGISVNFQALTKHYLEEIKIGDSGHARIISRNGTELYCPVPGHIGKSVFENRREYPSIKALSEDMMKGKQGTAIYTVDQIRGERVETIKRHAVYMPVNMADTYWSIVIAVSEDEIIGSLEGFRNRLIWVAALMLLAAVLGGYYGIRAWFIISEGKKRSRAEAALRQSESKLAGIIEFLPDATFVVDLEGRALAWNRAIEEMTGISKEDIMGKKTHMITCPFYGEQRKHLLDLIDTDDKELEATYTNLKRRGYVIYSEVFAPALYSGKGGYIFAAAAPLFDQQGNRIGAVESIRDITEQKRAEDEKHILEERVQRMEKMEALGTMAGGIAHDLNNVLGIVIGRAELLLYDMDESSPLRPHALNIQKGGDRAAAIVEDLLTLARRGVANVETLNLNRIVTNLGKTPEFEKLKSRNPSMVIRTELEPDLLKISGSSLHISKTLYSLALNASEAMPNGGELTIRTANQYLDRPIHGYDEVCEGDYVVLSVSDTGNGITETDLKRIFEPFYTKKVMGKKGTGMGLAVVWGTVKDHNGYIDVVSEPGKGSVFTLYFPVTREVIPAGKATLSVSEYMGKGETILVVDDVKDQHDLAAEMLKRLNYQVVTVSSGEEACEYLKSNGVDLIVLDMIMDPGMDGLDTYKKILELHPGQKAVIVSGYSESERVAEAQKLGAGPYIKKPYILEKLGLAVRQELDRHV